MHESVCDFLMRFHEISCFLAAECSFGWCDGCGRLSVYDGFLDVAWFCVCASWVVRLAGDECA